MRFQGKIVVITGAAGHLGRAVAESFAREGARRALLDIDDKGLRGLFGADGPQLLCLAADLGDAAATEKAVGKVIAAWGRIDILCNIAGGFRMGPAVHETNDELWRHMLDLNATSLLHVARAVVPAMLRQGGGKIVNIGANSALSGKANMAAYTVAKSAVIRLTEAMAAELRDKGINVNCVLPSIIDTPPNRADMPKANPAKWVAPDALADVIKFLASDESRAIHGAALPVVGLS